jgi:hypothetical protein
MNKKTRNRNERQDKACVGWIAGYRKKGPTKIAATDLELRDAFMAGWRARQARSQRRALRADESMGNSRLTQRASSESYNGGVTRPSTVARAKRRVAPARLSVDKQSDETLATLADRQVEMPTEAKRVLYENMSGLYRDETVRCPACFARCADDCYFDPLHGYERQSNCKYPPESENDG